MNKLDQIINEIANETIPEDRVEQAASRVRNKLFPQTQVVTGRLRGCSDYQALIPAYLNRTLSAGRSLLLQDHTRECPACRHALDQARGGNVRTLVRPMTPPSHTVPKWWAVAAAALLTVGVSAFIYSQTAAKGGGPMAVQNVKGILYAVSDTAVTPIFQGRTIGEGHKIRTAKDSTAVVKLADGSLVELNERAEISVARASRGTVIRLGGGSIIVQAAKQRNGTLDVQTSDCTVSVKGTIFAVDRGTKGSRVSVVEGAVQVAQGSEKHMLKPGQQVTTNPTVAATPVQEAVAWSRDSARYMSLLGEFSIIKKGIDSMPSQGLRHDPKLLRYAPEDTVLYAAIPNVGSTIAEAQRLFDARLQESAVLREWWEQQKDGPKLREMLEKLRTFSDYLGDEIVFTVSGDWGGNYSQPLLLAEVRRPGLDTFLENEFRQLGLHAGGDMPQVVSIQKSMSGEPPRRRNRYGNGNPGSKSGPMLVGLTDNLLAVAWNQVQLDAIGQRLAEPRDVPDHDLLGQVKDAYNRGVGYLLCVNMEQIARNTVDRRRGAEGPKLPAGLDAMRYLLVERRDVGTKTNNEATLTFNGNRSGIAGWLAEPAYLGSLDFVSPNATFVVSVALRSAAWMLNDAIRSLNEQDPEAAQKLEMLRGDRRWQLIDNIASALGGEMTIAIDGPLLPLPSWKVAVEVYSPDKVQWGIEQALDTFNRETRCSDCKLTLSKEQASGRTYYTIASAKFGYEIDYTFVDGYLILAPTRTLLNQAIQNRATGYVLSHSEAFRSQLPAGGNLNFSGLVYHNVGGALKPFADQIGNMGGASDAQKQSMAALAANTGPGLIYLYGQRDRITVASSGGFFGLDLNSLALPNLMGRALKGATH